MKGNLVQYEPGFFVSIKHCFTVRSLNSIDFVVNSGRFVEKNQEKKNKNTFHT